MLEGLKEALKKNIDKGLLTCRWECLSFAVGYLEKTVGNMPFEVIEFINTLYMDDYIGR